MVVKRGTGLLFGAAIALTAAVGLLELRRQPQPDTLYDFTEADVSALNISRKAVTLAFEKDGDSWQMLEPESAPADPAAVAYILDLLTTDPVTETLTVPLERLDTYGLDTPSATLELVANDQSYQLFLGDEDFTGGSLYVSTEMSGKGPVMVHVVPASIETGVQRPLDEWLTAAEVENPDSVPGP